ncbi:desulfoferrodoxin [Candidatus Pacearchaeota archaeon CG1_02_31_27]|nr:MAG: desulfoferrodoxin [Candidatus Pacearchaeota archaeon CG1_02_31_27]PIN92153.1 MAG: desulfoferrodoxin [Candidatus Pacearchaeota archaeon CG10_big_fil_rev_8_21_14_0_10_31_59]
MTKRDEIYRCNICGNIVEVLHEGRGTLVCCGQNMELQTERLKDEGKEKHVPLIQKTNVGIKVKIGSLPHPMEVRHYIEWIELTADGITHKKFLKPGDAPEAEFLCNGKILTARAYCNIHGLWKV